MTEFTLEELEKEIDELYAIEMELTFKKLAEIPDHQFSARFERKMQRLIKNTGAWRYTVFNTIGKKAAIIILCLIPTILAASMSVEALRNGLFEIIERAYKRFSDISFEQVTSSYSLPLAFEEYSLTYVPPGFTQESSTVEPELFSKEEVFVNGQQSITFLQKLAYNTSLIIDTEDVKTETIEHNGMEFLYCSNKGAQYLLWTKNDYAFLLISELSKEELLRIAASIQK